MKKFLSLITITAAMAVVMSACKNNLGTLPVNNTDTTGFAQFQAWKAMNAEQPANTTNKTVPVKKNSSTNKSGSMTSSTTNDAKVATKRGWSKSAKYSVIGGAGGAVLGAVINKRNRLAGGVIGGVLGGGLGYGIGRSKDKKEGRY
ncbi:MAG: glycine zipper domain-containing protein [Bacteroidota bacterium]